MPHTQPMLIRTYILIYIYIYICMYTWTHTHMQDADKEEPQEYGIERYFYTPIPEGNSCLLRQVRGYELEVLPKTLPVREITLALR